MTVVGPFGVSVQDEALEADLRTGLAAVEEALKAATTSDIPFLEEAARHLQEAGGKRFRPLLTLLAARFGDPYRPEVLQAAVAVELTHLATLYHDDVQDEAEMRRGAPSANARWDNTVAILTGDFLFARASQIVAGLGAEAVRIQAEAFERLVAGQILETVEPAADEDPVGHYLEVIAGKTGSLIAIAGRLGALLAGADDSQVHLLAEYGERIGVAFQLADDLLDIASDSDASGKLPGTDLREGVATLPLLMLRSSRPDPADPADTRLRELLAGVHGDLEDEALLAETLRLFRTHPALERARQETIRFADEARAVLAPLPEGPAKQALEGLCDAVVHRAS
ncbi:polyprenyl synthetase family protein [Allostreptomyces psammosilenae]|uniref:Heptaprenyl diphosphate synthase n=1 Tax=Allostreptomyces psammosilenae TaxID=1892865 RepID=A0A852ZTW4_9ACTN|nr:polyprenyl synthetase family protein [Allostreptomyces psammosilenae]NYI05843.1 heptaprenyl diphosphate synthase [Allostreptomyces psammosilenae]